MPCVATLDLWTEIYGSEAGNFAIRTLARGGIYIAGGIAVKVLPKLKDAASPPRLGTKKKCAIFSRMCPFTWS